MRISLNERIAIVLMVLATVGVVVGIVSIEKLRRRASYTVELVARAPENGNWHPRALEVEMGQPVRLYIRNIETVSHGFVLPAFEIAVPEIKAGHVEVVSFTPNRRGTFPFMCTVWCSDRHMDMKGELVVR